MGTADPAVRGPRWWGSETALLDDDEARRRLVAATVRCVLREGAGRIRVEEVAVEAGVSRSTVYRYFRTRRDLVLAVLLSRVDATVERAISSLADPSDAATSITDLFLGFMDLADGDPVSEALYAEGGRPIVESLELTSDALADAVYRGMEPLLRGWQQDGQLAADLDLRDTIRWTIAVGVVLFNPPWSTRSRERRREFLDRYVVRALVPGRR